MSLTLPASLPVNREFAPRSATQSVEKSDSVTPPLDSNASIELCAVVIELETLACHVLIPLPIVRHSNII